MIQKQGKLYVLSGPSGVGKSTVIRQLLKLRPELFFSISATTRKPRAGEIDGVNYYFVTKEKFLQMIQENKLLEHAEYVGNYYGTPADKIREKTETGIDVLLDIDVQGALQVKNLMPEAILIFILPPSYAELADRLRNRKTDSDAVIQSRLAAAEGECALASHYDYLIVNDFVERAAEKIASIITSESCRNTNDAKLFASLEDGTY